MVRRPSRRSRSGQSPSSNSGGGQETLPKVRKWSGDPPRVPKVVETILEVWNWSEDPHGRTELVGRPSRRFGSGWETLREVRKWMGDPFRGPEVVERPSRRFGSGRETLPEV